MLLKLFITAITLLFSSLAFSQTVVSNMPAHAGNAKKVLIIASNLTDMGDPEKHEARNDLWEYAPPYHVFVSHGYDVDFASPLGGTVPFMRDPLGISSYTIKYEGFLSKANNSLTPKQVNPSEYSAVFIGGGYGNVFDVASNKDLLGIIAKIYESGGVIGSVGHGAGAFANAMLSSGQPLVKGKRIAGFPNSTEKEKDWAKQGSLLPFLVEERLKEKGAITVNKDNIPDKHDVIIDDRIVSTMFLPSAALVAKEMLILLEKNEKPSKSN
ncbi:type 1 glutamine amidotransferase domain-containing protein [Cellvibrio sp. QJXJ]|uniref:type 1 glutamine amidotransferase domain-containing protein n=1 Tax=Cellvibrio sp. QJXJ TaxID=2964606 RepID=UPI0021C37FE9|nr:type 1 glutamine amidotransferase domain-containing protein [Cellvibrio sp. QJXJ]UUA72420.1 type 1 glutamine amidotransferase domain-containing protein [Cellvibrio sp. QJXJ]